MELGGRPTDDKTTPHANFHPIPRTFSSHLQNNILDMPRVRASVSGLRMDNRENEEAGTDACFEKHDDAMHMMTWQDATRK